MTAAALVSTAARASQARVLQAGVVQGLVKVLCNPLAPPGVKTDVTLGLKHLTASSQRNRDAFVAHGGLEPLTAMLAAPSAEAQYNR